MLFVILPVSDCSTVQNGGGQYCQQSKSTRVHSSNQPGERVTLTDWYRSPQSPFEMINKYIWYALKRNLKVVCNLNLLCCAANELPKSQIPNLDFWMNLFMSLLFFFPYSEWIHINSGGSGRSASKVCS